MVVYIYIYITYHLLREPETATLLTVILGFHTRFLEPTKSLANKRRRRVYGHLCLGHQGSTFLSKEKMGVRYLVYCFTGGFTIFCSKWCLICLLFFGGKRSNSSLIYVIPLLRMSKHHQWTILHWCSRKSDCNHEWEWCFLEAAVAWMKLLRGDFFNLPAQKITTTTTTRWNKTQHFLVQVILPRIPGGKFIETFCW